MKVKFSESKREGRQPALQPPKYFTLAPPLCMVAINRGETLKASTLSFVPQLSFPPWTWVIYGKFGISCGGQYCNGTGLG